MPQSAQANRINVSKIVYAPVLKDTSTEYTHGTVKDLGAVMQVQLTPSLAAGVLFGRGVKTEDLAKLTGVELQVDLNKVPIEVRAELMGNTYENGVLSEGKSDQAINIAVGFEVEETDDHRELMWLYKGKVKPFANTVKQSEDNITFSTDTITIGFVPRALDGKIRSFGDTANADFTEEAANTFLDSVPGNTNTITP
jgi:phi13 family phage major tail protein